MKEFESFTFSPQACRQELDALQELLQQENDLPERKLVLPFFRQRQHLSAFIGTYHTYISRFNRIAYEYDIFGDFTADLVIGDSQAGYYLFVEFESAQDDSLFRKQGSKATPEWSPKFEHGFSQIIDWFWKLNEMEASREFQRRFSPEYVGYEGILVIGRSEKLELRERDRLRWRREQIKVSGKTVHCVTFDELYEHLNNKLQIYEQAFWAEQSNDVE